MCFLVKLFTTLAVIGFYIFFRTFCIMGQQVNNFG